MKKYIIALVLIIIVVGAGFFYWQQNNPFLLTDSEPVQVACTEEAKICPDGSAVGRQGPNCEFAPCPAVAPVAQVVDQTADWKTYRNEKYGFEFEYPKEWEKLEDRSVVDGVNQLYLISEVADNPKMYDGFHRFTVEVSGRKEPLFIFDTNIKKEIDIAGGKHIAYFFPNGYECGMASPERKDCSFFVVPIERNGLWYKIYASGEAETISYYQEILASFKLFGVVPKDILTKNGYQLTLPINFEYFLSGYDISFSSSGVLKIEVESISNSQISDEYIKCTSYTESAHGPDEYAYSFVDLGGKVFCRNRFGEAGMGKTYGNYRYITKINNEFVIVSFALQMNTEDFSKEKWDKSLSLIEQVIATLVRASS